MASRLIPSAGDEIFGLRTTTRIPPLVRGGFERITELVRRVLRLPRSIFVTFDEVQLDG